MKKIRRMILGLTLSLAMVFTSLPLMAAGGVEAASLGGGG